MALKSTYTKSDLGELVFFFADHSSGHTNYNKTPISDHPLVDGAQGNNSGYDYSTWWNHNKSKTIFQYQSARPVLADNGTMPNIRSISPANFVVSSGNPPTSWSGTGSLTGGDYVNWSADIGSSLPYAMPSRFTEVIKKIFTTQNTFSKPHDTSLGNTIFNTSYATNLLNSVQRLVNSHDLRRYCVSKLNAASSSIMYWSEGYLTIMPVIDNIIEQYASTVNKNKAEVYFSLFKRVDLEKINILVYFTTYVNPGMVSRFHTPDWVEKFYPLYYITEIDRIPNALKKLPWYKNNQLSNISAEQLENLNKLRTSITSIKNQLTGITVTRDHTRLYNKGVENYNSAKIRIAEYLNK